MGGIGLLNKLFVLTYVHLFEDGHQNCKLLGVFNHKNIAIKHLEKAKTLEGFRDHLEGVLIEEYKVDQLDQSKLNKIKKVEK